MVSTRFPNLALNPSKLEISPTIGAGIKNGAYGKVTINSNQGFGIICADDVGLAQTLDTGIPDPDDAIFGPVPGVGAFQRPNNSASMYMQSTDTQDMRLGIYQTVNVVPGRDYRFSMSGTIEVQPGATTLQTDDPDDPIFDQNHAIEISFDTRGGTNWQAIPLEKRHVVEFKEEDLEFNRSSVNDPDLATIQSFETVVRARTDKLTIFITAWRKWANWRSARFTVDCIALKPLQTSTVAASPVAQPTTPAVGAGAEPVAITQPAEQESQTSGAPATEVQIIPPSGGILDKGSGSLLVIGLSVVLVGGLIGAGIWNIRRR
jgi:hypothetical protein